MLSLSQSRPLQVVCACAHVCGAINNSVYFLCALPCCCTKKCKLQLVFSFLSWLSANTLVFSLFVCQCHNLCSCFKVATPCEKAYFFLLLLLVPYLCILHVCMNMPVCVCVYTCMCTHVTFWLLRLSSCHHSQILWNWQMFPKVSFFDVFPLHCFDSK